MSGVSSQSKGKLPHEPYDITPKTAGMIRLGVRRVPGGVWALALALVPVVLAASPVAATPTVTAAFAAQVPPQQADSVPLYLLEPLVVDGRVDDLSGLVPTASVGFVGQADLRLRPILREAELLETVPGMILTQHSGDGKANQFFVRGFNLDHGTDFFTRVDGMPVNLRSHAHSHGYSDLNFLIPELVDHVEYKLGNYYADVGDFGSAGSAHFRLRREMDQPLVSLGLGEGGFQRLVAVGSIDAGSGTLLAGGEVKLYDGPWDLNQDLSKLAGVVRGSWDTESGLFSVTAMGYSNGWNASDQIPGRAVDAGLISRFGQVDSTLVGESSRFSLSGSWTRSGGGGSQHVDVYAIRYDLDLLLNLTFFLDDPMGDQIRQKDRGRWIVGTNLADLHSFDIGARSHHLTSGVEFRADFSDVSLLRSREGVDFETIRSDDVKQGSVSGYLEMVSEWSPKFRTIAGLRGDMFRSDITSDLPANSGTSNDALLSPKLSLVFPLAANTELYVSGGLGFHSNDGRGTVLTVDPGTGAPVDPADPLVRSAGAEVGLRSTPIEGWVSTFTLWTVGLESELIFVGDTGATEPGNGSKRLGVTSANFYRVSPRLTADLDVSFTRARHQDELAGEDRVLGAMENVVAAGVTWEPDETGGLFAAARVRHFGAYPLIEDNTVRADPTTLLNLNLGYQLGDVRFTLSVLNLLDRVGSDIEYYYTSRLTGEVPTGVDDIHFHPSEPRQFRFMVSVGG